MSKNSKEKRLRESALKRARDNSAIDTRDANIKPPPGAVLADHNELDHNNTYSPFPIFYIDKLIICRTCGKEEVWKAESQKWWYEEAKGNIFTEAVFCRECRDKEKSRKDIARKSHLDGLTKKHGSA